jgi:hypothetical protein
MARVVPILVCFFALCNQGGAAGPAVLRHVPKDAGVVLVCEQPHAVAELLQNHPRWSGILALPQVKAALEQPGVVRAQRLLAHVEKELGATWPEAIRKLAGNGAAISFALGDKPPVLLTLNGTDPAFTKKAVRLVLDFARGDGKNTVSTETVAGMEIYAINKELFYAQRDAVLYVATKGDTLRALVKNAPAPGKSLGDHSGVTAARALVEGDKAMVWGWLNFAAVKASPQGREFFATTRSDFIQTMLFGSSADAFRRSDFVSFALKQNGQGFSLEIKLPAKRADLPPGLELHVPPQGQPGSLPLLEPDGVTASMSLYLDLAKLWQDRQKLINDEIRVQI